MYQEDVLGENAIDIAFKKNSIFSIKLFVDSLLDLADSTQFKNCFDKAVLLMVMKGMDVKELVNSSLFYPSCWQPYTIFSSSNEKMVKTYNLDI